MCILLACKAIKTMLLKSFLWPYSGGKVLLSKHCSAGAVEQGGPQPLPNLAPFIYGCSLLGACRLCYYETKCSERADYASGMGIVFEEITVDDDSDHDEWHHAAATIPTFIETNKFVTRL